VIKNKYVYPTAGIKRVYLREKLAIKCIWAITVHEEKKGTNLIHRCACGEEKLECARKLNRLHPKDATRNNVKVLFKFVCAWRMTTIKRTRYTVRVAN